MHKLSSIQRTELAELEAEIETNWHVIETRGTRNFDLLCRIRDKKLYLERHSTFALYVETRWGISERRARQLIAHGRIVAEIKDRNGVAESAPGAGSADEECSNSAPVPSNERLTRPLAGLEPSQRTLAYDKAVESNHGHEPSRKQVEAAVEDVKTNGVPVEPDEVLPARLVPIFEESRQWKDAAKKLKTAAGALRQVEQSSRWQKGRKKVYNAQLESLAIEIEDMAASKPCPECGGAEASEDNDACERCTGKGFLTAAEVA